jgi:stage II sporulation protein D
VSTSGTKSISGIPENKKYVLTCTGAQGTVSKSASVTVVSGLLGSSLISFSRDLFVGLSGDDVKSLQDTLLEKGHIIPSGATGYFGQETKAALVQFQTANGITPAEGYFGSKTKELLN